jgi:hypothetical protein
LFSIHGDVGGERKGVNFYTGCFEINGSVGVELSLRKVRLSDQVQSLILE